jgi:hypothetical protein
VQYGHAYSFVDEMVKVGDSREKNENESGQGVTSGGGRDLH